MSQSRRLFDSKCVLINKFVLVKLAIIRIACEVEIKFIAHHMTKKGGRMSSFLCTEGCIVYLLFFVYFLRQQLFVNPEKCYDSQNRKKNFVEEKNE